MSARQMVAALAPEDAAWLGRWRTLPGYEACDAEARVWVRGPESPGWLLLPAAERFFVDESSRLTPPDGRVPRRKLPEGKWQPLTEYLRVRLPATVLPAEHAAPVAWSLVPTGDFREASLLLLSFEKFASWCLAASMVRLRPLQFALADDGRVCVRGHPLPSLEGQRWCVQDGLATPAGWKLPPGVMPSLVASVMQLAPEEWVLLHPDTTAERLPREAWVDVTRGAIRASMEKK